MAFTYVANTMFTSGDAVDTVTTETPLNVQAGDLLAIFFAHATAGLDVDVESISDGEGNDFVLTTILRGEGTYRDIMFGYVLSAEANSEAYFTGVLTTARDSLRLSVLQFRPGAGEVAEVDQALVGAIGTGTAAATGAVSTSGSNGVAVGLIQSNDDCEDYLIGGVAVDDEFGGSSSGAFFYRILSAPLVSGTASATLLASAPWMAMMQTFKAVLAGGGEAITWTPHVSQTMVFGKAS